MVISKITREAIEQISDIPIDVSKMDCETLKMVTIIVNRYMKTAIETFLDNPKSPTDYDTVCPPILGEYLLSVSTITWLPFI